MNEEKISNYQLNYYSGTIRVKGGIIYGRPQVKILKVNLLDRHRRFVVKPHYFIMQVIDLHQYHVFRFQNNALCLRG